MSDNKIVTVHKVNLGYDVEAEIEKELKSEISEETIEDAKDIIDALSERPGNKKAVEKIENDKKMEEIMSIIKEDSQISKDRMNEILGKNTISSVNLMRNFVSKNSGFKFVKKGKDAYGLEEN